MLKLPSKRVQKHDLCPVTKDGTFRRQSSRMRFVRGFFVVSCPTVGSAPSSISTESVRAHRMTLMTCAQVAYGREVERLKAIAESYLADALAVAHDIDALKAGGDIDVHHQRQRDNIERIRQNRTMAEAAAATFGEP